MFGSKKAARVGARRRVCIGVHVGWARVCVGWGSTTTYAEWQPATIWAESNDCGSVTIYFRSWNDKFDGSRLSTLRERSMGLSRTATVPDGPRSRSKG